MNPEIKKLMNRIVRANMGAVFKFDRGRIYLLRDHWRHLDPEDAPVILLGEGQLPANVYSRRSNRIPTVRILYLTEPL